MVNLWNHEKKEKWSHDVGQNFRFTVRASQCYPIKLTVMERCYIFYWALLIHHLLFRLSILFYWPTDLLYLLFVWLTLLSPIPGIQCLSSSHHSHLCWVWTDPGTLPGIHSLKKTLFHQFLSLARLHPLRPQLSFPGYFLPLNSNTVGTNIAPIKIIIFRSP